MSDSERAKEARATARIVTAILCTMFASGLVMWGVCWVLWTSSRGLSAVFSNPLAWLFMFVQLAVASSFALTAVLYFRDSIRARAMLLVSSVGLLLEMPLALAAILISAAG